MVRSWMCISAYCGIYRWLMGRGRASLLRLHRWQACSMSASSHPRLSVETITCPLSKARHGKHIIFSRKSVQPAEMKEAQSFMWCMLRSTPSIFKVSRQATLPGRRIRVHPKAYSSLFEVTSSAGVIITMARSNDIPQGSDKHPRVHNGRGSSCAK